MMITVSIHINNKAIYTRSAVNTGAKDDDGRSIYKCDTGEYIEHFRDDGALPLVRKMLETIREV